MDWLKTLAPMLGTALGGPLGGAAASFLADKLGLENKTIEAVTDALASNKLSPDQVANIKLAEIEFAKFLKTHEIDLERLHVQNTQGARDLRMASGSRTVDVLSIIIVLGFFAILTLMMLGVLKVSDQQALLILLGALSAGFGAVLNFWLGSSNGSQQKSMLLAQAPPVK